MTIDKSWTSISHRGSNEFLDGLFAFIASCEPLLHPITQNIRCPCRRCCNCETLVTLKTLEAHISQYGWDQHYTTWKYHGVFGENVYSVGERVRLGIDVKLRLLWRKQKNKIKKECYSIHRTPEEAKNKMPKPDVWGVRSREDWEELVDWFSLPDRVAQSRVNSGNSKKNTNIAHQGKKSFAQGRNEWKVGHGFYEDLIETWRKTHSNDGIWKYEISKDRYLKMKAMQNEVRAGVIPPMTDQEILDAVVPSENRQNMSGKGRKLPGGGSTSRRRGHVAQVDVMTRDEIQQLLRRTQQENELLRKQAEEAQVRSYLSGLKADTANQWAQAAYQNTTQHHDALGQVFQNPNLNAHPPPNFRLVPPPQPFSMPQLAPNWAHLLQPPFPFNQPLQPPFNPQLNPLQPPFTPQLNPLQPPYTGQIPFTTVTNSTNSFSNCYRPVFNSTNGASTSNTQAEGFRYVTNPHMNDTRDCDQLAQDLALQNNSVSEDDQENEDEQQDDDDDQDDDSDFSDDNE